MNKYSRNRWLNQDGIVAILAVSLIIILLSLVTLGFARLMGREYRQAIDRDLSTRAYYAAESGINDAKRWVAANPGVGEVTQCGIIPTTALDADTIPTCILLDSSPPVLEYPNLEKDKSQVFQVNNGGGAPFASLYFSWQSPGGTLNTFKAAGSQQLTPQASWGNSPPVLRITVYQSQGGSDTNRSTAAVNARTFFLYPSSGPAAPVYTAQAVGNGPARPTTDGAIVSGRCATGARTLLTQDLFHCNVGITGLNGNSALSVRMTPIYGNADVKVFASDPSGNLMQLYGGQTAIDVTARATDQVKRLRAIVNNRPIDPGPFGSVESASEVCKRLRQMINQPVAPNSTSSEATIPCSLSETGIVTSVGG